MKNKERKEFEYINEVLYGKRRICVPTNWDKEIIIKEFHDIPYTKYLKMAKTYKTIKDISRSVIRVNS
jgi:hypothetical protein